jgi:hypothetical protein
MIRDLYLILRCKFTGHSYVDGGSCPFTGKTYKICTKCTVSVEA